MRIRAIGVVLCLASLAGAPQLFADHHEKEKEKESKPAKESPAPKPAPPPKPAHVPETHTYHNPPPPPSHIPPATTGTSAADKSSEHKEHHGQPPSTNQPTVQSSWPRSNKPSSSAQPSPVPYSAGRSVHPPKDSTTSTWRPPEHHGEHPTVIVNHEHLQQRMWVHPDTTAREHAFRHSREERVLFERHAPPVVLVPAHRAVLTKIRIVPTSYHYRRTVFYDEYGWQPPMYVYGFYPRYGLWDATFLAFALDHIAEEQYALMFYHHQNDEEMQKWMADARDLAAENDELRAKLDALDGQVASFRDAGVESDASYVPPDAQDVALSPEVIEKLTSKDN